MDISTGDKLTIITGTHVLICTVIQVRARGGEGENQDLCCNRSNLPTTPNQSFQPGHSEATVLVEVEVQDEITRPSR